MDSSRHPGEQWGDTYDETKATNKWKNDPGLNTSTSCWKFECGQILLVTAKCTT